MSELDQQEMLNETMDTLKSLFNIIEDYLFIVDESGVIIEANAAAQQKLGYSLEELRGSSMLLIYPPERQEEALSAVKEMLEGRLCKNTIPLLTKQGNYVFVETRVFIGKWLGRIAAFGICKDISSIKTHQHLFKLIDTIPDLVFYKDTKGAFLGCNNAFANVFSGNKELIIGKTDQDLVKDPDLAEWFKQRDQLVLETGETRINEERVPMPDGNFVDLETRKTPFFDENGKVAGLIGIARDITARKSVERQLKIQTEYAEMLLNTVPCAVFSVDKKRKIISWNKWAEKLTGYSQEEALGKDCRLFSEMPCKEQCGLFSGEPIDPVIGKVCTIKKKNGQIRHITKNAAPVRGENGEITGGIECFDDITERIHIEEQLNKKEKILSAVAMSIKEFLESSDYFAAVKRSFAMIGAAIQADRVYLFQNTQDQEGNQYTSLKVEWKSRTGESQSDNLKFQEVPFGNVFSIMEHLNNGKGYFGVVKEISNERTRKVLEDLGISTIAVIPIFVRGAFWGFVGFDDCTVERNWSDTEFSVLRAFVNSFERAVERSLINEELEKSKKAAETASVLKGQFVANMSHEIRTPMNGIIGFIELLFRTELNIEQREYLGQLKSSSDTLLRIIDDILDYSKIEANKLELEDILFDIHTLIKQSVDFFMPKAKDKNVRLKLYVSSDVPESLYGDPGRLRQVLNNILGNALKFTEQGEINVKLFCLEDKVDHVKIQLQVNDTGIGISDQVLPKLFNIFSQADPSTTRKYGGTGLGLAISHRIIKLMGGVIRVDSTLGEGSTFSIELKLKKNTDEHASEGKRIIGLSELTSSRSCSKAGPLENSNYEKQYDILLVEDTLANQKLALIMLKQLGYHAELAENGKQAVQMCKKKKFHIILMDCQMPFVDGYEAASLIKSEGINKDTVIIAMTAHAMEGDREKCLAAGMDDYLSKPINMNKLDKVMKKWLDLFDHE